MRVLLLVKYLAPLQILSIAVAHRCNVLIAFNIATEVFPKIH
jgi:hypothetical protein